MAGTADSAKRLKEICDAWHEGSDVRFAEIVYGALSFIPDGRKKLAREFGCALTTVDRWASGVARPHPRIQRIIVETISRLAVEQIAKA